MSNDVVLTAALRNNLLSLQRTQSSIDATQLRLATGKKVNSALDNPQSFFASNALKNRASDLNRLLDTIGQNIQVIKAADNGVTALTKLVEQADSVAQSARDALAQGEAEAKVVGNRDLRGIDDLSSLAGIGTADTLVFSVTDSAGNSRSIGTYGATGGGVAATATITISPNESIDDIIAEINSLALETTQGGGTANGDQVFEASLNDAGQLQIRTLNGGDFRLQFASATTTDAADLALAADLGFSNIARIVGQGGAAGTNNIELTQLAAVKLESFALYDSSTNPDSIAERSDLLDTLVRADGTAIFTGLNATTDDFTIGINGETRQLIDLTNNTTAASIQDFIDDINRNAALNQYITAEFDDETGVLSIRAISAEVESIELGLAGGATATQNLGFGRNGGVAGGANEAIESIRLSAAAGDLAAYEEDFNNIRDQIDQLVSNGDTGYRGTNLLDGDDLLTYFNEFRTSSLETQGVTFTSDGLGIDAANFSRADSVDGALTQIREALEAVRNYGATLANDLAVIQTRQDFTQNLINTLTEGSDKLVNADSNEEGAKLLALQTRQSLGVTSLSLASQSQQSILRLF